MHGIPTASVYGLSSATGAFVWLLFQRRNPRAGNLLYAILAITLITSAAPSVLEFEGHFWPFKFDELLYRLDNSMGLFILDLSRATPEWVYVVFALIYKSLPWALTLWAAIHLVKPWGEFGTMMRAFLFAFFAALPLCLVVPACGPAYALGKFQGGVAPMLLREIPNAIPSMHMASAMLMLLFAGPSWRWRGVLAGYLIGTAGGTVLTGEHYFIDWVPSIPLVLGAAAAARKNYWRALAYLTGTVGLLVLIRFAGPWMVSHPGSIWFLVAVTLAVGVRALMAGWTAGLAREPAYTSCQVA